VKRGVGEYGVNKDLGECRYDAEKAVAAISDPFMQVSRKRALADSCMRSRGYQMIHHGIRALNTYPDLLSS